MAQASIDTSPSVGHFPRRASMPASAQSARRVTFAVLAVINAENFVGPCNLTAAVNIVKTKSVPAFQTIYGEKVAHTRHAVFFGTGRGSLQWVQRAIYNSIPSAVAMDGRMVKVYESGSTTDDEASSDDTRGDTTASDTSIVVAMASDIGSVCMSVDSRDSGLTSATPPSVTTLASTPVRRRVSRKRPERDEGCDRCAPAPAPKLRRHHNDVQSPRASHALPTIHVPEGTQDFAFLFSNTPHVASASAAAAPSTGVGGYFYANASVSAPAVQPLFQPRHAADDLTTLDTRRRLAALEDTTLGF